MKRPPKRQRRGQHRPLKQNRGILLPRTSTPDDFPRKVQLWFDRMLENTNRGIKMSSIAPKRLILDRAHPYFWAIVYSIQNIGECATQIDEMDKKILRSLSDIPEWKQIKGMRTILSHTFWQIETQNIEEVIQEGLPALKSFLDCFRVFDQVCNDNFTATHDGKSRTLMVGKDNPVSINSATLVVGEADYFEPGNCSVGMYFNSRGEVNVWRFHAVGSVMSDQSQQHDAKTNKPSLNQPIDSLMQGTTWGVIMENADLPVRITSLVVQGPFK